MKPSDGTATYLYCLVHRSGQPSVRGVPRGLPGTSKVRILEAGDDFWLVAADAPLDRYGPSPIEHGLRDLRWVSACAMSHEGVVEHFARGATVIPMKLFTLFTSDVRALAHVRRGRGRLRRLAGRIGGRQEWGLRLTWSDDGAAAPRQGPAPARRARSGTAFLLGKKRQRQVIEQRRHGALTTAGQVYRRLARLADEARRQPPAQATGGIRILLDAAFLVRASRAATFRAVVKRLAPRLTRDAFHVTLSGPWPPYTFVAGTR